MGVCTPRPGRLRDTNLRKSFGRRVLANRFALSVEHGHIIV